MKRALQSYLETFDDLEIRNQVDEYYNEFPDDFDESIAVDALKGRFSFRCTSGGRSILNLYNKFWDIDVIGLDDIWIVNAIGGPGSSGRDKKTILIELKISNGTPTKLYMKHGGAPYQAKLPSSNVNVIIRDKVLFVRFKELPSTRSKSCKGQGYFTATDNQ